MTSMSPGWEPRHRLLNEDVAQERQVGPALRGVGTGSPKSASHLAGVSWAGGKGQHICATKSSAAPGQGSGDWPSPRSSSPDSTERRSGEGLLEPPGPTP